MKQNKNTGINNPVLQFGSDVAKDLIKEEVLGHFEKAFKHYANWEKEIQLGMFKAMKDNRQPADLREWLLLKCKGRKTQVNALLKRYCRIYDNDWRRKNFLSETKNFWEASQTTRSPQSEEELFEKRLHDMVISCEKLQIENQKFFDKFSEHRDHYRRDHGWV